MCVGIQPAASCQFQYRRLILLFLRQRWLAGWLVGAGLFTWFFLLCFFQQERGSIRCTFQLLPNTLAQRGARDEPSSFLYISCCNKCATVSRVRAALPWNADFGCGVGSLHSSTHSSPLSAAEVSVCAGEVQSSSDASQSILHHFCLFSFFFFFNAFQWRGAQYAACMSSKNINTLKEELPHLPFFFFFSE